LTAARTMSTLHTASPEQLIDLDVYGANTGLSFDSAHEAYEHFRRIGQRAGINPSRYFEVTWYAWQNPDSQQYPTVLDHFLTSAQESYVDPAPFVDMVALTRRVPHLATSLEVYFALLESGLPGVASDVTSSLAKLAETRVDFLRAIELKCLRDQGGNRRNLVWVQSGPTSQLSSWFNKKEPRSWDLLCNFYEFTGLDLRHGETILRQSGTKFTGIALVLRQLPELLRRYDYVMFVDDDLLFRHVDLDKVFEIAAKHDLDMFQPSLSAGSYCIWPELFHRVGSSVRLISAVEVMMFGFSRRALDECAHLFDQSVSGFGLDFACSETIAKHQWRSGIIDAVQVHHPKQISESNGAYYEFMRRIGINQKLELFEMIRTFGKYPEFSSIGPSTPVSPRTATAIGRE
jgi:hypothetical protein